jgi:hypothetical protein
MYLVVSGVRALVGGVEARVVAIAVILLVLLVFMKLENDPMMVLSAV